MNHFATVSLWGQTIGAVALDEDKGYSVFEYDRDFVQRGLPVAPITMPLSRKVYSFPELSFDSFYGLPGLLADSLPDKFGTKLINTWLTVQGREPGSLNPIERLCYTGKRGMGALEFSPMIGPNVSTVRGIQIEKLVDLVSEIFTSRSDFGSSFAPDRRKQALADILRVGTSAGGARAKAVIAWNHSTQEIRSGQVEPGDGYEYWLLKFDGVQGNRDKELDDPQGYGRIEFAYSKMATDCGIEMSECRLLEENGRHHFMTRRFDRTPGGEKLHMQSLGAMAHFDFNAVGEYSYEQALFVIRQLELGMDAVEEQFRRMVFNIVARNQDDHVKNIAFLMNQQGEWALSPAFDMIYSFNPTGAFTASHQMSLNLKRGDFSMADFEACAKTASMKRGRAAAIIDEVQSVVSRWPEYADETGVLAEQRDKIQKVLRVAPFR